MDSERAFRYSFLVSLHCPDWYHNLFENTNPKTLKLEKTVAELAAELDVDIADLQEYMNALACINVLYTDKASDIFFYKAIYNRYAEAIKYGSTPCIIFSLDNPPQEGKVFWVNPKLLDILMDS